MLKKWIIGEIVFLVKENKDPLTTLEKFVSVWK